MFFSYPDFVGTSKTSLTKIVSETYGLQNKETELFQCDTVIAGRRYV
jgi:hypothetical protein